MSLGLAVSDAELRDREVFELSNYICMFSLSDLISSYV